MYIANKIVFEGTGEEVAEYAHAHPAERFRLIPSDLYKTEEALSEKAWDDLMETIHSFKGKLPVLPDDAPKIRASNAMLDSQAT